MIELQEPTLWTFDSLWQKSKLFVDRALDEERDGPLFPFWAALGLELLARATLARVHPVLLADHREPNNIFYALGLPSARVARSVPATTVFRRCQKLIPEFTEQDVDVCVALMERRNEDVHTGGLPFENWRISLWLAEYFRVCRVLLEFHELSLEDLFGDDEAAAAEVMLEQARDEVAGEVRRLIAASRRVFEAKPEDQRAERLAGAEQALEDVRSPWRQAEAVECPACGHEARVRGEIVRQGKPRLEETDIAQEVVYLPTAFKCFVCDLELTGYRDLDVAGLGGQFTRTWYFDPVEFHGVDLSDYFDDPYMNE